MQIEEHEDLPTLGPLGVPTLREELSARDLVTEDVPTLSARDLECDLLLRRARLLYPDVEEWILEMSVEAYLNQLERDTGTY